MILVIFFHTSLQLVERLWNLSGPRVVTWFDTNKSLEMMHLFLENYSETIFSKSKCRYYNHLLKGAQDLNLISFSLLHWSYLASLILGIFLLSSWDPQVKDAVPKPEYVSRGHRCLPVLTAPSSLLRPACCPLAIPRSPSALYLAPATAGWNPTPCMKCSSFCLLSFSFLLFRKLIKYLSFLSLMLVPPSFVDLYVVIF